MEPMLPFEVAAFRSMLSAVLRRPNRPLAAPGSLSSVGSVRRQVVSYRDLATLVGSDPVNWSPHAVLLEGNDGWFVKDVGDLSSRVWPPRGLLAGVYGTWAVEGDGVVHRLF
jgi:hypothetical protein